MNTAPSTILIVDDNPNNLQVLEGILQPAGYKVKPALSGKMALRATASNPPDLLLLDIRMPEMDGYEVCRRLKSEPATRDVPVIFVSAASETEEKVHGFEMGAVDYVTKPYQRDELLARVRTHLELYRLRSHLESLVEKRTAELSESEARYRRITEGLIDYQYTVRIENGRAVETTQSPACVMVTGYQPEEFAANPYLWILMVAEEDRDLVKAHVEQILAGKTLPPIEHRIIRKDGESRWVSDTTILFKDASGKLLSYDGVIKDITERRRAAEALARSHAELQRFAEISAHHLREPARRIATYAERLTAQLAGRLDDAESRLSLEYIGQQARRQQNLLRDVELYLAADQPRGEVRDINVRRAVAGMLETMADRISEAGAEITLGDLPAAHIDAPRLSDLFAVLLGNALKFGHSENPLRIAIKGERVGSRVRYSVSDNGPGVAPEYRKRVFIVFERLTTTREGTGIGLAILRRVVESTGGRAWIEETPGGGCRVLFDLPAGEIP